MSVTETDLRFPGLAGASEGPAIRLNARPGRAERAADFLRGRTIESSLSGARQSAGRRNRPAELI